jgi:hypothetical protein
MGRATALTFAREGASIVGCDVTVEAAEATVEMVHVAGGEMVSLHPCRLTDPADCVKLVELAVRAFGRIDVLFNLAARSHFNWLENVTDEEWDAAEQGGDHRDDASARSSSRWPLRLQGGRCSDGSREALSKRLKWSISYVTARY